MKENKTDPENIHNVHLLGILRPFAWYLSWSTAYLRSLKEISPSACPLLSKRTILSSECFQRWLTRPIQALEHLLQRTGEHWLIARLSSTAFTLCMARIYVAYSFLVAFHIYYSNGHLTMLSRVISNIILPVVKVDATVIHRGLQGVFVSLFRAIALQFSVEDDHVTLVS